MGWTWCVRSVVFGVVLAGSVARARADEPTTPPAAPGPALATFDASGLQVGDAALFTGAVTAAAYDRPQDLVWFVSGGTLQVVDLRAVAPAPVVVAAKLPAGPIVVTGWSSATIGDPAAPGPRLVLGKKPTVSDRKVKLVGAKWLTAQVKRVPRAVDDRPGAALPAVASGTAFAWVDDVRPRPLRELIAQQAAGRPVVLTTGQGGLVARTVDDAWRLVLVDDVIDDAVRDDALELIWLRRGGALEVVDLRGVDPAPITIATNVELPELDVRGVGPVRMSPSDELDREWATLDWSKKPRFRYDNNIIDTSGQSTRPFTRSAKSVKLVGKAWLVAQVGRRPRARPPAAPAAPAGRIKLPEAMTECTEISFCSRAEGCEHVESDACGEAEPFGQTGLLQVVVGTPGQCVLHDPARGFASLLAPAAWSPATADTGACVAGFDPTGTRYLVGSRVCMVAGCTDLGDRALGWLVP